MKKSHVAIAIVAVLIAVLFGVDYWLRANKKFVGGEVVEPTASPTVAATPKEESFETRFERASATADVHTRGATLLALEYEVRTKGGADANAKMTKTLNAVIELCPNDPASADAAARLLSMAEKANDEAGMQKAVQLLLDAAGRIGLYEKGVSPQLFESLVRHFKDQPQVTRKIQAALDSPENFGPENVREIMRFRVGMKLEGEPFPAADKVDQVVKFRRRNLTKAPLSEELSWQNAQQGPWHIEPLTAHVSLAPGEEKTVEFHTQFDRSKGEAVPFPSLKSVITREGEPEVIAFARVPMDTRGYRNGRVIHCVRVQKAPTIDGKTDDDAWTHCKPVTDLYGWNGFTTPKYGTQISVCYDDAGLYLAIHADDDDMTHAPAVMTDRDADVCRDDSVEFMFNPKPEQTDYFQVIVNSKNTQYDGICWDRSINFNWKSATSVDDKGWTAELFLPWSEFAVDDIPKAGTKFVANFYRNRYRDGYVLTQWSPSFVINNHLQEYYGTLLFE
jgi:hypothetical protein